MLTYQTENFGSALNALNWILSIQFIWYVSSVVPCRDHVYHFNQACRENCYKLSSPSVKSLCNHPTLSVSFHVITFTLIQFLINQSISSPSSKGRSYCISIDCKALWENFWFLFIQIKICFLLALFHTPFPLFEREGLQSFKSFNHTSDEKGWNWVYVFRF